MRTPLCIANWKMHGTLAEARPLATGVRDGLRRVKDIEVVLEGRIYGKPATAQEAEAMLEALSGPRTTSSRASRSSRPAGRRWRTTRPASRSGP